MLIVVETMTPWAGEKIAGKTYQLNIETLWSKADLNAIGLAKLVPVQNGKPLTKLHKKTGATRELVGGEVIETPTYALYSREEVISMLAAKAWALFGEKFFIKDTLNDWTGYRASLRTRGLALLAAYDETGHDIDVNAGSIDGQGAWPD